MIQGFFYIMFFYFIGELFVAIFSIPIPGSVVGMLFLLVALFYVNKPDRGLLKVSTGLLKILPLLFVPVCTGLIVYLPLLQVYIWQLLLAIAISIAFSVGFSLLTYSGLLKLQLFVAQSRRPVSRKSKVAIRE